MFDWLPFLASRGIGHSTKGHGATRNQVVIHCPWCGAADQGLHLSINLEGEGFRCLRSPKQHFGKSPARLVAAILKCSMDTARSITGEQGLFLSDDFQGTVARNLAGKAIPQKKTPKLILPKEFKPFLNKPSAEMFIQHMKSDQRKFTDRHIRTFSSWGIRYCTMGYFKGRIIFPIYFKQDLVTWTGRTIYPRVAPKYLSLSDDPENPSGQQIAKGGISQYLLWYNELMTFQAHTLVICEGPMDALKIMCLGAAKGIVGTCIFTAQPSRTQIDLFHELVPKFKRTILLLDQGTTANAMRTMGEMPSGVEYMTLPPDIKDPCLLTSLDLLKG